MGALRVDHGGAKALFPVPTSTGAMEVQEAWNASGDTQEALKGEALVWRSLSILLKQVGDQEEYWYCCRETR